MHAQKHATYTPYTNRLFRENNSGKIGHRFSLLKCLIKTSLHLIKIYLHETFKFGTQGANNLSVLFCGGKQSHNLINSIGPIIKHCQMARTLMSPLFIPLVKVSKFRLMLVDFCKENGVFCIIILLLAPYKMLAIEN